MVRLTDHVDMTIVVDLDAKQQNKQTNIVIPILNDRAARLSCAFAVS